VSEHHAQTTSTGIDEELGKTGTGNARRVKVDQPICTENTNTGTGIS